MPGSVRGSKRQAVGAGLLALAACGLPEVDVEGVHVRLAIESGLAPCGDPAAHMDRFIELVAAELRVTPPVRDDRIDYYWLQPDGFDSRVCFDGATGCAFGSTIYASSYPIDHELVHSLASAYGLVPSLFAEGLAVTYGLPGPGYEDYILASNITIADLLESHDDGHLPGEHYTTAGAFVAFLIERHGVEPLLAALRQMRWTDRSRRVSRLLEAELGVPLATLVEQFEAARRRDCPPAGFRRKLFECSAPEIAWNGALWAGHRTLDCDRDDAVGPFASDTLATYQTITIPEDATYALTVIGDADGLADGAANTANLLHCGGCDDYLEVTLTAGEPTRTHTLTAGRYSLRYTGPIAAASGVGLRIERVEVP